MHIPPKDTEHYDTNIFYSITGTNPTKIEDIKELSVISESQIDYAKDKHDKQAWIPFDSTYEMTFTIDELINIDDLGIDTLNVPSAYDIQYVRIVQARKHKKKRINKKWLKRYGYKQITVEGKGWKIKTDTDGNVEFIK